MFSAEGGIAGGERWFGVGGVEESLSCDYRTECNTIE